MSEKFEKRKEKLKTIRDKLLRLHKVLMDNDRELYETQFGSVSSGKFLELLLSDDRFLWLRTISGLIVNIDETFDLDDGVSTEMVDDFFTELADMFSGESTEYVHFNKKLDVATQTLPEVKGLKAEIMGLLEKQEKWIR